MLRLVAVECDIAGRRDVPGIVLYTDGGVPCPFPPQWNVGRSLQQMANFPRHITALELDRNRLLRQPSVGAIACPGPNGWPAAVSPRSPACQDYLEVTVTAGTVSYTHLRAHETRHDLVFRLL